MLQMVKPELQCTTGPTQSASDPSATPVLTTGVKCQMLDQVALVHEFSIDGRITNVNALMCERTGYSAAKLIGSRHEIMNFDVDERVSWLSLHRETSRDAVWAGQTLNRKLDGSDLWLSSTIYALRDQNGAVVGYVCASIDVTESSRLREEFDRNGKLMQLGQLTATVAHEIRNPLGAIRTANYVLERKIKGKVDGVEAQLERINNGISRCDKIITDLLDFSRQKPNRPKVRSVDEWISSTIEEEARSLSGAPAVTCELGLGDLEAAFDQDQIRQVLINLLSNASEAIAEKVRSGAPEGYKPQISIRTKRDGCQAVIIVQDNGPGIAEKNIRRIREPLFTTKSFGVGLGIPAIEKILEKHGGKLAIESNFGEGATISASFALQAADLADISSPVAG